MQIPALLDAESIFALLLPIGKRALARYIAAGKFPAPDALIGEPPKQRRVWFRATAERGKRSLLRKPELITPASLRNSDAGAMPANAASHRILRATGTLGQASAGVNLSNDADNDKLRPTRAVSSVG